VRFDSAGIGVSGRCCVIQIQLSGSSGFLHAAKEVEMNTYTSRSSDEAKEISKTVRRRFVASLVAAASFALVLGQGGPSAKAGS